MTVTLANLQYSRRVTNPTTVDCHICNLLFDGRQIALVGVVPHKATTTAIPVAAQVPLLAFIGLAILDHIFTATIWATHWL